MKFEHTEVMNFKNAFRGLRNPLNSWSKSDSAFGVCEIYGDEGSDVIYNWMQKKFPNEPSDSWSYSDEYYEEEDRIANWLDRNAVLNIDSRTDCMSYAFLGPNDLDLAQRMIAAGSPNDKFLRQIFVSVDITGPLYWWKEFDTYKVGTVANSTSTMHKLASTPITRDCFEMDDYATLKVFDGPCDIEETTEHCWNGIIEICETLRQKYNETKDIRYWKELIRILPEGWLQTRTVTMNYSNLRGMYHWRKDHKLTEWHTFCDWIKTLPYAEDLILYKNE